MTPSHTETFCPVHYYATHTPQAIAIQYGTVSITYLELHHWVQSFLDIIMASDAVSQPDKWVIDSDLPPTAVYLALIAALRLQISLAIAPPFVGSDLLSGFTALRLKSDNPDDLILPPFSSSDCRADSLVCSVLPASSFVYLTTSGTAGLSKCVAHSFSAHFSSATAIGDCLSLQSSDKWLVNLPLHHISGLAPLFRMMRVGGTVVFSDNTHEIARDCIQYRITQLSCVSATLLRVLNTPDLDPLLSSLRGLLLGGGPVPDSIASHSNVHRLPIFVSYGMTETASAIAVSSWLDFMESGQLTILPHFSCRADAQHQLFVRGESLFQGYFNDNVLEHPISSDGYFPTGDLAYCNSETIRVMGRGDRMFISGGENVYPSFIEHVFLSHSNIQAAYVEAIPDPDFQFVPILYYAGDLNEADLDPVSHTHLPRYARPRSYVRRSVDDPVFSALFRKGVSRSLPFRE